MLKERISYFLYFKIYIGFLKKNYPYYTNYKIKLIRKKDRIRVMFVIGEVSSWKTESLYKAMLNNERFEPILAITDSIIVQGTKKQLVDFLQIKQYSFVDIDGENGIDYYRPDLLLYYKPYEPWYYPRHVFLRHLKTPCLFINYAFSSLNSSIGVNQIMHNLAWRIFAENEFVRESRKLADNKGKNGMAYNIADNSSNISIRELAEMIAKIGGKKVVVDLPSDIEKKGFNVVSKSVFSVERIEKLGWKVNSTMVMNLFSTINEIKNNPY